MSDYWKLLDTPFISITGKHYLTLMALIALSLNFLSGISIDLYAPSMPAIANYFHTSDAIVKNTITMTMVGFAFGSILFGVLFDTIGRKLVIVCSLIVYIISSAMAPHCHFIYQLMIVRFVQGMMTSAMSIGSRALVMDHFTGQSFIVMMIYTSVAYGLGPVIAPFIGGYLQYHFGWQANFYAYLIYGLLAFAFVILFVQENFKKPADHRILKVFSHYKTIGTHKIFLMSVFILGFILLEQMVYPTMGSFLVQYSMGYDAIVYGYSALFVGLSYLAGTLINRFMLRFFSQPKLIDIGFFILLSASIFQLFCTALIGLKLWSLVAPISVMGIALGFIFPNILSYCLRLFPNNVGIASATQVFLLMIFGSIGTFIISYINLSNRYNLFFIYLFIIISQFIIYTFFLRKNIKSI